MYRTSTFFVKTFIFFQNGIGQHLQRVWPALILLVLAFFV